METKSSLRDDLYTVLYDYKAQQDDELTLIKGSKIRVLSKNFLESGEDGWWIGRQMNDVQGIFPCNYVSKIIKENQCINKVIRETPACDMIKIEKVTHLRTAVANAMTSDSSNTNSTTTAKETTTSAAAMTSVTKKETTYKNEKINEMVKIEDIPHYTFNELEFKEFINSGGFSKVFKGVDLKKTRKEVAIKEVQFNEHNLEKTKQDFYQEAKLCWYLDHPNVIKLYGICVDSLRYCLVMEYAKGGSLRRLLSSRKNGLPPYVLISWALQVAYGMLYLHEQANITIIHRDLKSSNILLSDVVNDDNLDNIENIILKLSDFGLARETNNNDGGNIMTIAGTYSWMSPEVLKSAEYSKASDVWSFGVLLWELLTGEVPFEGFDHAARIVYGIVGGLRLPIPSSCPDIFSNLLKNCWCDEPSKRLTFPEIIGTLNEISNSSFASTPSDSFKMLQEDWKPEINEMFEQMYNDMKKREAELYEKEEELVRIHNELEQREKELEEREKQLIERELLIAIKNCPPPPPPEAKKRRNLKNPFNNLFKPHDKLKISSPSDFQHWITVQQDGGVKTIDQNSNDSSSNNQQYASNNNLISNSGAQFHLNTQSSANIHSLPMGCASPSLSRLRVVVQNDLNDPSTKGGTLNPHANSYQTIQHKTHRDKSSQSNENSADNLTALLTPKGSRARHFSRPKTPKQTTIWYHNDLRSNSLDSDIVFNEKSVDTLSSSGPDSGLPASSSSHNSRINNYNQTSSSSSTSYHHSASSSSFSNSNNNKKVNRIVYEIGSFLASIGLGKDYKKECFVDTKPPKCSMLNKVRKSASPNTIRTNAAKLMANSRDRDLTPPASLSRVNKTFPYRLKPNSNHVNKHHHHHHPHKQPAKADGGTISLQSSPKLSYLNDDLFNNLPSSPINRTKKQQSKSTILSSPTDQNNTDDSGIYGDTRAASRGTTTTTAAAATTQRVNNLIRPGTLNIKSALEKSNVFQKRKDLLTSSNSTEDDDHYNQESVINQLINASNMMKEQMKIFLNTTTTTPPPTDGISNQRSQQQQQQQQKRTCNLYTPPAFSSNNSNKNYFNHNSNCSLTRMTPSEDNYLFVNSNSKVTTSSSSSLTAAAAAATNNGDGDDDDIQSTVL